MTDPRQTVYLAVPNTGWIHTEVVRRAISMLHDQRYQVTMQMPSWKPVEHARARIHEEAVRRRYDWLVTMDSDNPPMNNPLDLIELNLDMVGLPTPIYQAGNGIGFNAMKAVGDGWLEWPEKKGLQQVDAVGFGCVVVSRRVLVATLGKNTWERETDENGFTTCSEDFAFCKKVRAAGYRVFAHFDYACEHYKEHPFQQFLVDSLRQFAPEESR